MKKPNFVTTHYMPRECEILVGIILSVLGIWLLWLAYDQRGKKMMWPFSGLMPV